jgi:hypothetical protein
MKLLEEAAKIARRNDRNSLIYPNLVAKEEGLDKEQKVFLITTFHLKDHSLRQIVFNNWDLLGMSQTTSGLYEQKLMLGYRRPTNLKDFLVKANLPHKEGDDLNRPEGFIPPEGVIENVGANRADNTVVPVNLPITRLVQKSIRDFFPRNTGEQPQIDSTIPIRKADNPQPSTSTTNSGGTPRDRRGFNFCNNVNCRYCPKINKTGQISSSVTGREYRCMENDSCRSSNLIYCITCTRCKKQYVGQTSLRLNQRFVHHFYSITKPDVSKPVGKHFSSRSHNGIKDVEIHILEFIKKPPTSEVASRIRDRVEKQ